MITPTRLITIPACIEHCGQHVITARVPWVCIKCGCPRGEPHKALSFDGSLRLEVDGWSNPCGHVEKYSEVREWLAEQTRAAQPDPADEFDDGEIYDEATLYPRNLEADRAAGLVAA